MTNLETFLKTYLKRKISLRTRMLGHARKMSAWELDYYDDQMAMKKKAATIQTLSGLFSVKPE